jgi:MFS superfamily sulfate permease-like transporter
MLSSYNRTLFFQDQVAGLVLTAMLAPVGIAYAEAAGLSPIYGLYAIIVLLLHMPYVGQVT